VMTAGQLPLATIGVARSVVFMLATVDAASAFPENAVAAAMASVENNKRFIVAFLVWTNLGGTAARG